jgi:nitroreductase
MELREALRTTGAVREFTNEPVPDEVVARVLETARFAPSGGNRQAWHVVVVKGPMLRRSLRDSYLPTWYEYLAQREAGLVPWAPVTDEAAEAAAVARAPEVAAKAAGSPEGFAEKFDGVPVLLAVFADLRALAAVDKGVRGYTFVGGASVYPFVWSILLAARDEGLAGTITTMNTRRQAEVREALRAPDHLALACVVALGYPVHQPTRLTRRPVESFATVDRVDGPPLGAP